LHLPASRHRIDLGTILGRGVPDFAWKSLAAPRPMCVIVALGLGYRMPRAMELDINERRGERTPLDMLLKDIALGSRQAFEKLYRDSSPRLFAICLRIVSQRSEAEDVLQEVYATVWHKAAQYDVERAGAMSWLAMIARNKAIDRIRSQPQTRKTEPLELAEAVPDPTASPQLDAQASADRVRLDECLNELDARRRSLIRAAFFDGSTYEELAVRIGSPLGTVKSWIRRSLLQLRECLER
jgi:RNA polymerase sigma-70 factor (ECF subfamily)